MKIFTMILFMGMATSAYANSPKKLTVLNETVTTTYTFDREYLQELKTGRAQNIPELFMIALAKKLERMEAKQDCMMAAIAQGGGNMGQKAAACMAEKKTVSLKDFTPELKVSNRSGAKTKDLGEGSGTQTSPASDSAAAHP